MSLRRTCLALLSCTALAACGDDPGDDGGDASTGDTGAPGSTSSSGATDAPGSTGAEDPTSTGDDPAPTSGDDTGTDGDSDSDSGEPSPYDGEPLPPGADGEWTWVDFPEARCRDGSSTGIGVRRGGGSGLVFYFEGGGACFNAITCGLNPVNYDPLSFEAFVATGGANNFFSTDVAQNPVGDWTYVYIPYCTGDVHAGARPDGEVPGVFGPQQFVGYTNVGFYLNRVVPTFLADVDRVLVAGQSAGGFGAAFNYDRIAEAFPNAAVSLLDDSGPPMADEYMAACLQKQWRDAWGLDLTMPADCDECFPEDGGGIVHLAEYLGAKYPDQHLALISSVADNTIRFFFGYGADDCDALLPSTPAATFEAGLVDLRDDHLQEPEGVWGTFYLPGDQHTWIGGAGYFTAEVDGVKLIDWVRALVAGETSHVAP
jgi:hypothetical protein